MRKESKKSCQGDDLEGLQECQPREVEWIPGTVYAEVWRHEAACYGEDLVSWA